MTTPPGFGAPPGTGAPATELTGADLSRRIAQNDPNFPRELWGKTVGEAMRYYAIMRQDFINRNQGGNGQPPLTGDRGGPPAGAPPAPAPRPTYTPPAAPPAPPSSGQSAPFDMESMRAMIDDAVTRAVRPMATVNVQTVYQQVRSEFHDWQRYDAEIQQSVASADPESKLNPELWRGAYFYVKGKAMSQPGFSAAPPAPEYGHRDSRGAIITPPPSVQSFTEAPTPPSSNGFDNGMNSAEDEHYARRFGISVEEYRAWKNGNVPQVGGTGGR